jgi:hypothetical protein
MDHEGLVEGVRFLHSIYNTTMLVEFTFGQRAEHCYVHDITLTEVGDLKRS